MDISHLLTLIASYPLGTALAFAFLVAVLDAFLGWTREKAPFLIFRRLFYPWQRYLNEMIYLQNLVSIGRKQGWRAPQRWTALSALKARRLTDNDTLPVSLVGTVQSCLTNVSQIIVAGETGSGKTVMMQCFLCQLAEHSYRLNIRFWSILLIVVTISFLVTDPLPWLGLLLLILVPLWEGKIRRWPIPLLAQGANYGADGTAWTLTTFLEKEIAINSKGRLLKREIEHLVMAKRLIVFFDGMNEIKFSLYPNAVDALARDLGNPLSDYSQVPLIITTRLETEGEERLQLSRFNLPIFAIMELDDEAVRTFLAAYNVQDLDRKLKEIEESGFLEHGSIGRNPFWLEQIARTNIYAGNVGAVLNSTVTDSLRREVSIAEKRYHHSVVNPVAEQNALASVGGSMLEAGTFALHLIDAEEQLKAWLSKQSRNGVKSYWVIEEAEGAGLIQPITSFQPRFAFRHEWFLYFFSAWALGEGYRDILRHASNTDWWRAFWLLGGITVDYSSLLKTILKDQSNHIRSLLGLLLLFSGQSADVVSRVAPSVFESLAVSLHSRLNIAVRPMVSLFHDIPWVKNRLIDLCINQMQGGASSKIRRGAALALGASRDSRVIDPLMNAFLDVSATDAVIEALVCIGKPVVRQLIEVVQSNPNALLRRGAVLTLGQIEGMDALDVLISAFDDSELGVREAAVQAVSRLGEPAIPHLESLLKNPSTYYKRFRAVCTLGRIKGTRAASAIMLALEDNESVRHRAIDELCTLALDDVVTASRKIDKPSEKVSYGVDLALAGIHSNKQNTKEALEFYQVAESIRGDDSYIFLLRGRFYRSTHQHELALEDLSKYLETVRDAFAHFERCAIYEEIGQPDKAIAEIDQAISIDRSSLNLCERGRVRMILGDYDSALEDLDEAVRTDATYAHAYVNRAICLKHKGKLPEALEDYDRAISLNPEDAVAHCYRALAFLDQKRFQEALADCNKAVSLKDDYAEAFYYRARILFDMGEFHKAITDWEKAIALGRRDPNTFDWLGNAYSKVEEFAKAIASYNMATQLDPNYAAAHVNRAVIYEQQGKAREAMEDFERYLTLNPNNPYWEQYAADHIRNLKERLEREKFSLRKKKRKRHKKH